MAPSAEFLELALALLEAVRRDPGDETTLLQLAAVFGPMLVSALQLIDRREGRAVYQVTSSTGRPYTLYLDLPVLPPLPAKATTPHPDHTPGVPKGQLAVPPSAPPTTRLLGKAANPQIAPSAAVDADEAGAAAKARDDADGEEGRDHGAEARELGRAACPCTGFAFNSLAGQKNVFCKHILAVLVAHWTGRLVESQVGMNGVADLLGLASA